MPRQGSPSHRARGQLTCELAGRRNPRPERAAPGYGRLLVSESQSVATTPLSAACRGTTPVHGYSLTRPSKGVSVRVPEPGKHSGWPGWAPSGRLTGPCTALRQAGQGPVTDGSRLRSRQWGALGCRLHLPQRGGERICNLERSTGRPQTGATPTPGQGRSRRFIPAQACLRRQPRSGLHTCFM